MKSPLFLEDPSLPSAFQVSLLCVFVMTRVLYSTAGDRVRVIGGNMFFVHGPTMTMGVYR